MMINEYCENILIQQTMADFLQEKLGWKVSYAHNKEKLGANGTYGRESYEEVILPKQFAAAVKKLNSWLTDEQLGEVKKALESHLASASLMTVNEEKHTLLKDGVNVSYVDKNGERRQRKALLIDFDKPENNDFLAVQELKIASPQFGSRRTDIVGFVNGIPLLFVELKKQTVDIADAYNDNYRDYLHKIPQLFYYNAFIILSNGLDAKIGTLGSKYAFFHEWKRLQESEQGRVDLETMLLGVCKKENLIDLLENFIVYDHSNGRVAKIMARNHQYLGVNLAFAKYANRDFSGGRLGVFWHTQGSGKSYSMLFLTQKIKRKLPGSPTFVMVTDREELNKQLSATFANCGALGAQKASSFIASSGEDLIDKLKSNGSYIFTLIHKFNKTDAEQIVPNHELFIISDEAHRSQYGDLAENMCRMLPSAIRIGFTGTPLFTSDAITRRTFGDYISVYDFQRAVDDKATVPLYYENRADKIKNLHNPKITDELLEAIANADLDDKQKEKLEHDFAKEYHLLTAQARLDIIARDFVKHYSHIWETGKAMFVCLNKITCVRMYDLVQKYWQEEITQLEEAIKRIPDQQDALYLQRKLDWMQQTKMAVVISQEQNEEERFAKWGLDIVQHRRKMLQCELDKEYKDSENPLRIVFVCAMWLTGFDIPSLSCLYLDKPLKAHTLMQTIARANRVAEGKTNGLIIDYVGIIKALRKALAAYTNSEGKGGVDPTIDKEKLIARIMTLVQDTRGLLLANKINLDELIAANGFAKIAMLQDISETLYSSIELKKRFQLQVGELMRLLRYLDREEITEDICKNKAALSAIEDMLHEKRRHVDTTDIMVAANEIISRHLEIEQQEQAVAADKLFDLSKIDFAALAAEFKQVKHKNTLLRDLEGVLEQQLEKMCLTNPARVDYYKRYNEIIDAYNKEQDRAEIEKLFNELMNLSRTMSEEAQRYVRENFDNDEQLALYDLLFSDELSKQDIKEVKQMVRELYKKVTQMIAEYDHWKEKETTCAAIKSAIGDTILEAAPDVIYDKQERYQRLIYQYFYNNYQ